MSNHLLKPVVISKNVWIGICNRMSGTHVAWKSRTLLIQVGTLVLKFIVHCLPAELSVYLSTLICRLVRVRQWPSSQIFARTQCVEIAWPSETSQNT